MKNPGRRFIFGCVFMVCATIVSVISLLNRIVIPDGVIELFKWGALIYVGGQTITDLTKKKEEKQ